LLIFSALAFAVLMRTGLYPPELRSTNLDSEWFYRRAGYAGAMALGRASASLWEAFTQNALSATWRVLAGLRDHHGLDSALARAWPTGNMAFWMTVMLAAYLLLSIF
jgi:multicomponent Na+:H+ antiporter subunit D